MWIVILLLEHLLNKCDQRIDSANAYLPAHFAVYIRQLFAQLAPYPLPLLASGF